MLKLKGPSLGIMGRFKLDVLNSKGELVKDKCLPEQKNLITENGLKQFLSKDGIPFRLALGTGSTPPQREDVLLDNFLTASPTSLPFRGSGYVTRDNDTSFKATREFVFDLGQVVGNITELGLAYEFDYINTFSYSLVTRALIKDASGNATSIELLADEQLRVTYTLQVEISDSSEPYTLSVINDGSLEDHSVTPIFRMKDLDSNFGIFVGRNTAAYNHQNIYVALASDNRNSYAANSGEVRESFSVDRSTYTVEFECYAGINSWSGEIAWIGVTDHIRGGKSGSFNFLNEDTISLGSTTFMWQIDPPITKTVDQVMEIICSLSVTYGD